jgi:hypothetical protein
LKGQESTQYLIMLALLVLAGAVLVLVVSGLGDLVRNGNEADSSQYWITADIGLTRYSMAAANGTGTSTLAIRNNKGYSVLISQVQVGDAVLSGGDTSPALPQLLSPAQSVTLVAGAGTLDCGRGAVGATYSLPVAFTYTDVEYNSTYIFRGERPIFGLCE